MKRFYIPLPEWRDREILLRTLLKTNVHVLSDDEITKLSSATHGYSGADLKALCTDASMGPIRDLGAGAMKVAKEDVPPISYKHFLRSLKAMNPSVSEEDLNDYIKFNDTYGNKSGKDDDDDDSKSTKSDTPAQQPSALVPAQGSAGIFDAAAQAVAPFSPPLDGNAMLSIIHARERARERGRMAEEHGRQLETALMAQMVADRQAAAPAAPAAPALSIAGDGNDDDDDDVEDDRKLAPGEQPKK